MTITSHTMVMYSSAGVYMFAYALITKASIHKFEYFGYSIFFIGIFLILTDPYAVKERWLSNQYIVDHITLINSIWGTIQEVFHSNNSKLVHPIIL